jgi:hypothetical protein
MLTALVAVPGVIAAVYFGIIQYRREEAMRSPQTDTATEKVEAMLRKPDESVEEKLEDPEPEKADC